MSQVSIQINGAMAPIGETALPPGLSFPFDASEQAALFQIITVDPSTGLASLADDNTPNQIAGGFTDPDQLSVPSTQTGAATARTTERWMTCSAPSTIGNDGFSNASIGTPWWIADGNTPGALSHTSTKNRSLGGLVLGPVSYNATPVRLAGGPVYQAIARGVLAANDFPGGSIAKAIDSGAGTDLAEAFLDGMPYVHGPVTRVDFIVTGATLAASGGTDYKTFILWKRTAAAPSVQVVVATADTKTTAWTQYTRVTFTLSAVAGAVDILEDDILSIGETHGGSGAIIPAGKLSVYRKVI